MKLIRFEHQDQTGYGILNGDTIEVVDDLFSQPLNKSGRQLALAQIKLLSPCQPRKIICAGINYRAHAKDGHCLPEQPLLFLKPPTAATGPDMTVPYPAMSHCVGFEGELAVVIGRHAHQIDAADAHNVILGYTCANDVTARDIQEAENNYGTAKSFPGFAPFGPCIATDLDPSNLWLETRVNGQPRQRAHTSDLLFPVPELVAYISQIMPLEPGDLILTGTPRGFGEWRPGDQVEIHIDGIGTLSNQLGKRLAGTQTPRQQTLEVACG